MKKIIIPVLLFCMVIPAFAGKRAFTIADLYRIKAVSDPQFSPDGRKIAFVVTALDLEKGRTNSHLYLIHSDGSDMRQLTFSDASDTHPRWSPDGKWLMFVSTRTDNSQIWLMPTDFGEPRQLTAISTGVSDPIWSPDSRFIAFASEVFPECSANDTCNQEINHALENGPLQAHVADSLLYRHWTEYQDGRFTHVLLIDIESKEVKDLTPGEFHSPPFSLGGPAGYAFSPDGKELCFVSRRVKNAASSTNHDLFIVTIPESKVKNISGINTAYDGDPQYSPDGRFIAYRCQQVPTYEADRFQLALYERESGQSWLLTENFDNWINSFCWSRDAKAIYLTAEEQGYNPLYRLELSSQRMEKIGDAQAIDGAHLSSDGRWLTFSDRRVHKPLELYKIQSNGKNLQQLTFINQAIVDCVDIRPAEQVWLDGAAGKKIHVFIVKPHNFDPAKKYPLIVNVHGGPQQQWIDSFRGDWQVYPGAGYVVAFLNPHGSTGYGQAFTAAISKDWSGKVIEDIIQVTRQLAKLNFIDEHHIGAMGWSYGGYVMAWLEGHNPDNLFKCLASMMPVYDLRSMFGATEELWFPEWDLAGQPWSSVLYQSMSPSNFVENFHTPMLVITGERDYRVPYTQSLHLFTDLQKMQVPSRLIVFKNDGHWPNSIRSMPFYYNAHLDWFHKYLGGDAAPWDMKKMGRNLIFDWQDH